MSVSLTTTPRGDVYSLHVERRGRPSNEVWRSKLIRYRSLDPAGCFFSILLDPAVGAVVGEADVLVQHFLGEER